MPFDVSVKSNSFQTKDIESIATEDNISNSEKINALNKIILAKDNEIVALLNRVSLNKSKQKLDSSFKFKQGEKDKIRHELNISDKNLEKTNQSLLVENEILRTKLKTSLKNDNSIIKNEFSNYIQARKNYQSSINEIVSNIQKDKSDLNNLLVAKDEV